MRYLLDTHTAIWALNGLTLISVDENVQKYDVSWVW
jgi:PIN domain nuclease of toxin-antitoxin system